MFPAVSVARAGKRSAAERGRTKGGQNSKLHTICDSEGRSIILLLSEAIADTDRPYRCKSNIIIISPILTTENPLPTIGRNIGGGAKLGKIQTALLGSIDPVSTGRIVKQGNKWLRWAFVEAVAPAIAADPQLRAQYEHLKSRGSNKARVAVARKLLTIAFQVLRDQRPYERRCANEAEGASSTISRLS